MVFEGIFNAAAISTTRFPGFLLMNSSRFFYSLTSIAIYSVTYSLICTATYSLIGGTAEKLHDKSAGRLPEFRLGVAVQRAPLHHTLKPRPPAFDEADVVEYFGQPPVARDRAVFHKQALDVQFLGKKSRAPDLQAVVEDTDLDVAGVLS